MIDKSMKQELFYKLTSNVQDASDEECTMVMNELNNLTDDDLLIARNETFDV